MEPLFVEMAQMGDYHQGMYNGGMFVDSMQYAYDPLPCSVGQPQAQLVSDYLDYQSEVDLDQLLFPEDSNQDGTVSQVILLGTDQQHGGSFQSYPESAFDSEESQEATSFETESAMRDYFSTFEGLKDIQIVPIVGEIDNIEKYINEESAQSIPIEKTTVPDEATQLVQRTAKRTRKSRKEKKTPVRPWIVYENSSFVCDPCGRTFARRASLLQHNNVHHSGPREHRCDECGKRYHTLEDLHRHVQRHVALDKPHKCNLCPRQFNYHQDLERHVAVNHGVAKFQCRFCDKRFGRRDHLLAHEAVHAKKRNRLQKLAAKK